MALTTLVAVAVAALGLSADELAQATDGGVPTRSEEFTNEHGHAAGRGWGAIVIERPVADVWATLARCEDRAEYVPRLKSVTVLAREPQRLRVRQEIDATVTTARYVAWFRLDEGTRTISWTLDKSAPENTVKQAEGDYRMAELGPTRTLLVYRAYVDSGLRVPLAIQSYLQKRAIPNLLRAIKRRVESGGTWRKP